MSDDEIEKLKAYPTPIPSQTIYDENAKTYTTVNAKVISRHYKDGTIFTFDKDNGVMRIHDKAKNDYIFKPDGPTLKYSNGKTESGIHPLLLFNLLLCIPCAAYGFADLFETMKKLLI